MEKIFEVLNWWPDGLSNTSAGATVVLDCAFVELYSSLFSFRCRGLGGGAEACVLALIGEKNREHYIVATQDSGLKDKLKLIPGVLPPDLL